MGKNKKTQPEQSQRESKTNQLKSQSTMSKGRKSVRTKSIKRDSKPRQTAHLEHIPFRLREIMKSKEMMKLGVAKRKAMLRAMAPKPDTGVPQATDIPVPNFQRGKKESKMAYMQRIREETQHVQFLTLNQVERQPELEPDRQEKPADTRKAEKKKEFDKVRLERLQKKKMAKREEREEKEKFTEKVQFGEVAMAPPSLTAKPRKAPAKSQGAPKELLLSSLLGHSSVSGNKPSMARQRMMEEERERVVNAYRHLKAMKQRDQGPSVKQQLSPH
ncbi:coiled-coil domain-containing protein 137 [Paramormyrops kingsleyae]|uniref:Coiled-coil domain containing 137 n=1 Tax=Paramormyrops kingsleyae TaxID=1676925 RepID=A0A3B3RUN4_9TELE|nr:coiled-coil domain-containing protein 137 [Paramormyrops kingsleyae]